MKKKFLSLMLVIAMISGILPTISFAAKINGKITFVDESGNNAVTDFEDGDRICAKISGLAEGNTNADVYAASYKGNELLGCKWLCGQPVMNGMPMNTTTNVLDIASGADEVRVFVWDMKDNMKPLLAPGVIYKKKASGGSSADVNNSNGFVGEEVSLMGENVSASVPEGVQLSDGAEELTLTMQSLDNSASGVEAGEGQALASFDVHIDGVSEENNVPIIVTVDNFTKEGYNKGNLELYHVEKDGTKPMSEVSSTDELDEHNTYYYNPETGSLTLALASFSEIAVVSEIDKGWKGNVATGFNSGTGTEEDPYIIANADQLAYFGEAVGGMLGVEANSFEGNVVKLTADINLADAEDEANNNEVSKIFHPIGYYYTDDKNADGKTGDYYSTVYSFEGTFDGNGHTISNFYQNTWEIKGDYDGNYYDVAMGLFGYVVGGTVKNLTVDNFSSDGEFTPTGVIAAYAVNSTFANIAITNCNPRVYNTGNGGIVGIGGESSDTEESKLTFNNITIDNTNKITALWGSWDVACGGLVGMFRGLGHVYMTNCHVAAQMDVNNDVCGNYQYYWYRYAGMMVGTNKNMVTDENGYTVPETSKFHAEGCTVHFGNWNDYYYCELVANSLASYTHDHQFSRLTEVDSVDVANMTVTIDGKATAIPTSGKANYVVVNGDAATENATCYHFVNGAVWNHEDAGKETVNGVEVLKEDNQHIYLPFNQLFTGYGWGVKHIPVYNGKDYAFEGITILDRKVADSVVKFETKFTGDFLYRVGNHNTVSLNSLFKAKDGATINNSGVYVSIDKVDENMNVSGTYKQDENEWRKGTIQFTGTGVVKVTIQDYNYCTPTVLYLEVVDAENATSPISATKDKTISNRTENNVVLLNDISGGFTVSDDYTVYGNGFTLNYTDNGQYLNNGLKQGIITVSGNGVLDNLRIKASIYPKAYLYYGSTVLGDYVQGGPSSEEGDRIRYHYQLSAIAAKGNATISNCYVYGGRTNIFVDTGDVTIKDSVLECGTVANVQVQSTNEYTVTLEDVTTIQHQVNSTIVDTKNVMFGAGMLVGPDTTSNPKIVLNGDFKQYNWVTADDANEVSDKTITKAIIQGAVNATAYNHIINGKTASNLGIIYMNTEEAEVTNNTGLPYKLDNVTMKVESMGNSSVDGMVYSLQNATANQIYSDYENADRATEQGDYFVASCFNFDLGDQEISYDGAEDTRYLYGDKKGVTALYKDGEAPLTLDISKLVTVSKYTGINYGVTAKCINESGNELTPTNNVVTLVAKGAYTLEFTVNDNLFYDATGKAVDNKSVTRKLRVPLTLDVKAADIKNAVVNITKTALDGEYNTVNFNDYELRVKFLDCISVTDYDNKGTGTTVNLSSNISSATLTPSGVNVFTTASTITITYTDGRVLTVNMSKISGSSPGTKTAKINTSGSVYFTTEGALNNKPTATSSQNKCTITSVSYKGNNGSTVTNDTDVTVTWALGSSSGGGCVTPDTLVTLSDGSQKRIDELTHSDTLKVWDFEKGEYTTAPIAVIRNHGLENNTVVTLEFSDGTVTKVVNEHGYYNKDLKKFVAINANDAQAYIGHSFVKEADGSYETVVLENVTVEENEIEAWSLLTAGHYNFITDGIFSISSSVRGLEYLSPFEHNDSMQIDEIKKQQDVERYGMYTYEDFEGILTKEQFDALNMSQIKVSVGKGIITWEDLMYIIEIEVFSPEGI